MDRPLHPDDIVARKADESQLGVIERTHGEVDTHEPWPERSELEPIRWDRDISYVAFRRFTRDGVPPKGTVLVRWQSLPAAQLLPEAKLKLLDRSLLIGDVVKKNVQDAMSGIIINTFTKCTLQPMGDIRHREQPLKGLLPPGQPTSGIRQSAREKPAPIVDVPACELKCSDSPMEEDLVIYKDWIGRVEELTCKITLKLADNCVVEIDDKLADHADGVEGAAENFSVGDIAVSKKGHLRAGRWIFGQYSPNTHPVGTVVQTRTVTAEITWLQRRIGSSNDSEPPVSLERDELESSQFYVYDRTIRPLRPATGQNTISNSEIDVRLGLRVRFKDLAGACVKYDGSSPQGKVPRIDRQDTLGYDINVFDVVRFHTDVTVQWQDLSTSTERSIDLVPDDSIDDEHAAWPGEIAHTLDAALVPNMPTVEQPGKVGVIQSVNATERMARIRWAPDAVLQYSINTEEGYRFRSLLTGAVGFAAGEVEEVSLYDVEAPAVMNVRRGDIVLIGYTTSTGRGISPVAAEMRWLGEIVDTCPDGTLVVRLGVSNVVQDIVLRREDVVVAIRSDGTDEVDDWEEGPDLSALANTHDVSGYEVNGIGHLAGFSGQPDFDEDDIDLNEYEDHGSDEGAEEEPEAKYEDENGQPMDEDEAENEDWESEDGDEEMADLIVPQQIPPTPTSVTPIIIITPTDEMETDQPPDAGLVEPEQYLVLDSAVPASHRYANEPSTDNAAHMKRTQKEHRILQKPGAIPEGVYIRTWESRLDLVRALIIGPAETPYQDAPFVVDFYLPRQFPAEPPHAHFHSWTSESGLGGVGRVNPNLYEDGKICLSLLGTWEGSKGEGWNASRSTLLQVVVSLLGLVLVKEPYFNEAGYEPLAGLESSKRPSALYSERTFLKARTFVITALTRTNDSRLGPPARDLEGLESVVRWLYEVPGGPRLIDKVVRDLEEVLRRSEVGGEEPDGVAVMSRGLCIPLRRALDRLWMLQ